MASRLSPLFLGSSVPLVGEGHPKKGLGSGRRNWPQPSGGFLLGHAADIGFFSLTKCMTSVLSLLSPDCL
jgi:hypothetical protein